MNFYLLNHEATFEDLKRFNFPNQKVGVIAHIENEKEKYYYNKEEKNHVMKMDYLKI